MPFFKSNININIQIKNKSINRMFSQILFYFLLTEVLSFHVMAYSMVNMIIHNVLCIHFLFKINIQWRSFLNHKPGGKMFKIDPLENYSFSIA